MLHRRHALSARVRRLAGGLMAHQLLAGDGMLSLGEPLEVFFPDLSREPPTRREFATPDTANHVTFGVVVLSSVLEFLFVIAARLAGAQRFGDREHRQPSLEERLLLHDRGHGRPLVGDDRLRHR